MSAFSCARLGALPHLEARSMLPLVATNNTVALSLPCVPSYLKTMVRRNSRCPHTTSRPMLPGAEEGAWLFAGDFHLTTPLQGMLVHWPILKRPLGLMLYLQIYRMVLVQSSHLLCSLPEACSVNGHPSPKWKRGWRDAWHRNSPSALGCQERSS